MLLEMGEKKKKSIQLWITFFTFIKEMHRSFGQSANFGFKVFIVKCCTSFLSEKTNVLQNNLHLITDLNMGLKLLNKTKV